MNFSLTVIILFYNKVYRAQSKRYYLQTRLVILSSSPYLNSNATVTILGRNVALYNQKHLFEAIRIIPRSFIISQN